MARQPHQAASGFKVRYAVAYRQTPFKCAGMSVVVLAIHSSLFTLHSSFFIKKGGAVFHAARGT
jgi:hypothetical protein